MMKQTLTAGLPGLNLQLPEERIDTLVAFGRAMVKQNEVMNLTGITDDKGVANLHLLDSLTVLSPVCLWLLPLPMRKSPCWTPWASG